MEPEQELNGWQDQLQVTGNNEMMKEKITKLFGENRVIKINFNEMFINTISRRLLNDDLKNVIASTVEYIKKGDNVKKIKKVYLTANSTKNSKKIKNRADNMIKFLWSHQNQREFEEIFDTQLKLYSNKIGNSIIELRIAIENYDGPKKKMLIQSQNMVRDFPEYANIRIIYASDNFFVELYQHIESFKNIQQNLNGIEGFSMIDGILKNFIQVLSILFDYCLLTYSPVTDKFIENFNLENGIEIFENVIGGNNTVHAEVHLAFKLIQLLNGVDKEQEFFIGVSKLCCPLCSKNLDFLNSHADLKFKFRYPGSHNLIFTCHNYIFNSYPEQTMAEDYAQQTRKCLAKWLEFILRENERSQTPIDNKCYDIGCACQNNHTNDSKPSKLNQISGYNQSPDVFYPYDGEKDSDYSKFISNPKIKTLHKISNILIANL